MRAAWAWAAAQGRERRASRWNASIRQSNTADVPTRTRAGQVRVRQACPGACVTNLRTCIVSDFLVQNGMSMDEALKKAHELEAKEQHERVSDALCPTLLHAACWP